MKAQLHIDPNSVVILCTPETDEEFEALKNRLSSEFNFAINFARVKATDGSFPIMSLSFAGVPQRSSIALPTGQMPPNGMRRP